MAYPQNPNTIILKNSFYPNGLREIDVWNYYQKMKGPILKETINRNIMLMVMVDVNKLVIRKKTTGGNIRLTQHNYDQIISGRTISIHSEMNGYETFGIIDIDIHPGDNIRWAKTAASNVYDYVMDKMPLVRTASIRFTGKTSFHVICEFGKKMKVDTMKFLLEKFLRESNLSKIYTINQKRQPGVINLDLNRNCFRCNHITLHSLSEIGLKCMNIDYSSLIGFDQRNALL